MKLTEQEFLNLASQHGVPAHTAEGLRNYFYRKLPPGAFLRATLQGNLFESFLSADSLNAANMRNIIRFLYDCQAPAGSWGSKEGVVSYLSSKD